MSLLAIAPRAICSDERMTVVAATAEPPIDTTSAASATIIAGFHVMFDDLSRVRCLAWQRWPSRRHAVVGASVEASR